MDPDKVLKEKIVEFVRNGDFGLASGPKGDSTYERLWFQEPITPDEIAFEPGVLLLKKQKAAALKKAPGASEPGEPIVTPAPTQPGPNGTAPPTATPPERPSSPSLTRMRISGTVPAEQWNRMGTKILPKLRSGKDLRIDVSFSIDVDTKAVGEMQSDLGQVFEDLGLGSAIRIDVSDGG